ncbi:carboxylesterase, putative [Halanaerobium hydrogeniformans]|uniref:Carboxylesterase, putative n=1 Tax=Halanaerobium hydrogeniformans TaxID=656519 RepID=E4RKR7_HALHG|nr:alpha/beta fold hydrolase [Halanaerobium hydrogeniformans]ADQ14737.1 carboxylesterase, putative [Halanaerobium hydrogeniformans]
MQIKKISTETKINPLAEEIKLGFNDKSLDKAVLLLHGFAGRSNNWKYIAEKIYQQKNTAVYVPRLPGHGSSSSDFRASNSEQWLRKSVDSYLYLKSNFEKIYLAGLSMGGLLAALLAANFKIEKLSLIAPAFYSRDKKIALTPIGKYFIEKIDHPSAEENKEDLSEEELDYRNNYNKYYYLEQLAELYALMKKARKEISKPKIPTQLIISKNDRTIANTKTLEFLNKKMGQSLKDIKIYQESSHVITNDVEKEKCASDIIDFFFNLQN